MPLTSLHILKQSPGLYRRLMLVTLLALPAALHAQTSAFELHLNGKTIGKDTYTIKKTKQGYQVESRYSYGISGYDGRFDNDYKFDADYLVVEAAASNLNTATHYYGTLNKPRTELSIAISQNGTQSSQVLPVRSDVQILPNFDPACAQLLLLRAVTHPTADNKYNVIVPSFGERAGSLNGGGGNAADPGTSIANQLPSSRQSYDAVWAKAGDVSGMLNGKPVTVHTYTLVFGTYKWIFLADDQNDLLQMNVTPSAPSYVLQGFQLDAKDLESLQSK